MNKILTGLGIVTLIAGLVTLLGVVQAEEPVQDAQRWAEHWVSQTRTTEYQGTLVVNNGRSGVQAFDLWHQYRAAQTGQGDESSVNWHASWMPEGFERQLQETRGDGGYQLWTDGVVKVSVMVDPVSPDQPLNTSQRQGADALVARVHGDWQVVIVGAVPASTAEQIAAGLSWD